MILTVFDTETSGLNPDKHEILEIALLTFIIDNDGKEHILKQYEQKLKPKNIHLANSRALQNLQVCWQRLAACSKIRETMAIYCTGPETVQYGGHCPSPVGGLHPKR